MNEQVNPPNAEDARPPFPSHLRRAAGEKKDLTDEEADRELEDVAQAIETFARQVSLSDPKNENA